MEKETEVVCSHLQWEGKRYKYNAKVSILVNVTPKNQELEKELISSIEKNCIENITLTTDPGMSTGSLKKD